MPSSTVWPVTVADNQTASSPSNSIVPVYTTNGCDEDITVKDSDAEETTYRGKDSINATI